MARFQHEIVIHRPVAAVFEAVADVQTHPKWQKGLLRAETPEGDYRKVGAKGAEVRKMFGREMRFPYEISEFEPLKTWGFRALAGPIRPAATLHFSKAKGGGTLIRSRLTVPGLLGGLAGRMLLSQERRNYLTLKKLLEENKL